MVLGLIAQKARRVGKWSEVKEMDRVCVDRMFGYRIVKCWSMMSVMEYNQVLERYTETVHIVL